MNAEYHLDEFALKKFRAEKKASIEVFLNHASSWMASPLFLIFWIADWLYAPQHIWLFLALRLSIFPVIFYVRSSVRRARSLEEAERLMLFLSLWYATAITAMVALSEGPASPYYAGINLVSIGMIGFLPWAGFRSITQATLAVYAPYYCYALFYVFILDRNLDQMFILNSFFLISTAFMSFVMRVVYSNTITSEREHDK